MMQSYFEFLPHEAPMIWVDQLLETSQSRAKAKVNLDLERPFWDDHQNFIPECFIEMMAQVSALYYIEKAQKQKSSAKMKRAFLAGVSNAKSSHLKISTYCQPKSQIHIEIEEIKNLPPFSLVKGQAYTHDGELLCRADLKLFGEWSH